MNLMGVLSFIGSLLLIVLVLVLVYYSTRWYAKRMSGQGAGTYIKIVDKAVMGAGTFLAIIQVAERYYLVGVSDKNMQLLTELPDFTPPKDAQGSTDSFGQMLHGLLGKTPGPWNKNNPGDPL